MSEKLAPCPFCGGKAVITEHSICCPDSARSMNWVEAKKACPSSVTLSVINNRVTTNNIPMHDKITWADHNELTELWNNAYCWKALSREKERAAGLVEFMEHRRNCIRTFQEAGRPTEGGGYETKFKGKWYQSKPVNEEPKCNCGLDEALRAYQGGKGE